MRIDEILTSPTASYSKEAGEKPRLGDQTIASHGAKWIGSVDRTVGTACA
jgi:hypothetical protein